jgi:hypothetical protein
MPDDQHANDRESHCSKEAADATNAERKHLEGLLKDRINFHLLFASVFMAGVSMINNHLVKLWALITIAIVSFLIALAVLRTHLLVCEALKDIKKDRHHPYTKYDHIVWFHVNANTLLLAVPFVLTFFFLGTVIYYFVVPSAASVDTSKQLSPSTVYRIEDNSDRRIISAPVKSPARSRSSTPSSRPKHRAQ